MAFLRLGSKSEAFHLEGQTWHCKSGLPSDVVVKIGEMSYKLHKFPLMSRSRLLEKRISDLSGADGAICTLQLDDIPGGAKAFELIAKFCYGVKMELTALNVVGLRCAAEYLKMDEELGEGNLIAITEGFLNKIFGNWAETVKALKTCEEVLPFAEELHIVSRCINSLATKACVDSNLFNWPVSGSNNTESTTDSAFWNGITSTHKTQPVVDDWWYEDVAFLSLPIYKRLIQAVQLGGMKPERVSGSIMFYAKRHLDVLSILLETNHVNSGSSASVPSEADQRAFLEEILKLLPNQKGATLTKFLIMLLRAAMILHARETLYDIECFQRILDHFMSMDQAVVASSSPSLVEEGQLMEGAHSLTSLAMVANLVDAYLADVAPDANLKFPKFLSLAAAIPDYARPLADGIYRAIDVYLKAHPWLTDAEREQVCRLMNCQKLSLDASTHAAQNERLPLRVIVQVLFFEQLRLRTSLSGWFFISDNLENSQNQNENLVLTAPERGGSIDDVRERLSELETECRTMRREIHKLRKTKKFWDIFFRRKTPHKTLKNQILLV
ncbi:hypothetical protein NMG60_11000567 [Bertholletia excelsa]